MLIDLVLPELIFVSILGCAGLIFAYLKKKFKCQSTIQSQLNTLDQKFNAIMKIYIIILEKTHPDKVEEFKKLFDLATNDIN